MTQNINLENSILQIKRTNKGRNMGMGIWEIWNREISVIK